MSESKPTGELILDLMQAKAMLKKQVFGITNSAFTDLKSGLKEIISDLKDNLKKAKGEVDLGYKDNGEFEVEFNIVDDTIVFILHSNVFTFHHEHPIWKVSYVKEHPANGFCGKIDVYNFLSDSFRFNRVNDTGYLIARIFINREGHFFIEGKRQLGFLYNNFESDVMNKSRMRSVLESAILYTLDFELFTPPYEQVQEITLQDIILASNRINIATGKRLGFRFQSDNDTI